MTTPIRSTLARFATVGQQMTERKSASLSTLLGIKGTSVASLTEAVCSAQNDRCSVSTISQSLAAVAKAAKESGVSDEVMDNVRAFASQLQDEGYDTLSIMDYLKQAEELAQSDPDRFSEIFSGTATGTRTSVTDAIDGSGA